MQTQAESHGILTTAPPLGAFKQGVGMTRKRGTCVLVGLPPGEFPVPLIPVEKRAASVGKRNREVVSATGAVLDGGPGSAWTAACREWAPA